MFERSTVVCATIVCANFTSQLRASVSDGSAPSIQHAFVNTIEGVLGEVLVAHDRLVAELVERFFYLVEVPLELVFSCFQPRSSSSSPASDSTGAATGRSPHRAVPVTDVLSSSNGPAGGRRSKRM